MDKIPIETLREILSHVVLTKSFIVLHPRTDDTLEEFQGVRCEPRVPHGGYRVWRFDFRHVLVSSRLLSSESLKLLYGENDFGLGSSAALRRFVNQIGPSNAAYIRRIWLDHAIVRHVSSLCFDLDFYLVNLERLTLSMAGGRIDGEKCVDCGEIHYRSGPSDRLREAWDSYALDLDLFLYLELEHVESLVGQFGGTLRGASVFTRPCQLVTMICKNERNVDLRKVGFWDFIARD